MTSDGRFPGGRPLSEVGPPSDRMQKSNGGKQYRCQTCHRTYDTTDAADEHHEATGHKRFKEVLVVSRRGSYGDPDE